MTMIMIIIAYSNGIQKQRQKKYLILTKLREKSRAIIFRDFYRKTINCKADTT